MHFGNWLKIKRTHLNLSLTELAAVCECSKNYLSVIERNIPHNKTGCLPHPSDAVFNGIAHGLGLSVVEVQDAWDRLGNSHRKKGKTLLSERDTTFEHLKVLYSAMEEADRKEMMAYAQFRVFRRNPQSASLMESYPPSGDQAGEGGSSLRVDMDSGSVYTHDGQRVTDRKELLEASAMIKAQVTLLEIETAQSKEN